MKRFLFLVFINLHVFYNPTDSGAVVLNANNIDQILANNELVLINFYADWCRFSNMLAPIWDEAADKIATEITEPGKVVVAKIDCDKETNLGTRFHITKYPTLKYSVNGVMAKKEYRGSRTAEAFLQFAKDQLKDSVTEFTDLQQIAGLDEKKRYLLGYFETKESPEYQLYRKLASNLKEDCFFYAGFGEVTAQMHPPNQPIVSFRTNKAHSSEADESFKGNYNSYDELSIWASEKCTPLVREITFENAEEMTEEGLPFLILFRAPDDDVSVKEYTDVVRQQLLGEKQNVNFLIADGIKFAHPLHHLGKTKSDLPLIAIDSFRHMYLFPEYAKMKEEGVLLQFLKDLYSGKLHREFHYGPEETTSTDSPLGIEGDVVNQPKSPPPSQFQHLGPSKNRYTLLHDEF